MSYLFGIPPIQSLAKKLRTAADVLHDVQDIERALNSTGYTLQSPRAMFTPEGGFAIKITNGTGATSVKGSLVSASTTTDNAVILQANEYDTLGIVYESGVAAGEDMWIVVSGRAQVLVKNATAITRGMIIIAADTDGRAIAVANPGSGLPTVDVHFKECGHYTESKNAGTDVLAWGIVHFN
jgi:hypothetical protein